LQQRWNWTLVDGAKSTFTIMNDASFMCLAIGQGSHDVGAYAIQWTCDRSDPDQQWIYDSTGRLWNKESNLCLAIPGANTSDSVIAIQWTCEDVYGGDGHYEQQWFQRG